LINSELSTNAIKELIDNKISFNVHKYQYDKGGTLSVSHKLNIPEYIVIKTLVFEDDNEILFLLLMHGNKKVDTKSFAKILNVNKVKLGEPDMITEKIGYSIGSISPFGIHKDDIKIYVEESIMKLEKIFINGGTKGISIEISPEDLNILNPIFVSVVK